MTESGRDADGRFLKGKWKGGPGRPRREIERTYLEIVWRNVSPRKWAQVVKKALEQALEGDHRARVWLGNYLCGRPPEQLDLDILAGNEADFRIAGKSRQQVIAELLRNAQSNEASTDE